MRPALEFEDFADCQDLCCLCMDTSNGFVCCMTLLTPVFCLYGSMLDQFCNEKSAPAGRISYFDHTCGAKQLTSASSSELKAV